VLLEHTHTMAVSIECFNVFLSIPYKLVSVCVSSPSSSAPTMDHVAEMFSEPDLLQNDGFSINMTATNTSSISTFHLSPVMDKVVNIVLIVVLFITMVSLGCTMEVSKIKVTARCPSKSSCFKRSLDMRIQMDFRRFLLFLYSFSLQDHIVKPKGVVIAVLSQYGIMPLTAFCLAKVGTAASFRRWHKGFKKYVKTIQNVNKQVYVYH